MGMQDRDWYRELQSERDRKQKVLPVSGGTVSVGPMTVTSLRLGVGLQGQDEDVALLGQSFLSKFDVMLQKNQMILQRRQPRD